jgi:uncharacterized protein
MKRVTIYLGSKCNMNCAYCHREAGLDEEKGLPQEFYERLRRMAKEGPLTVKFMGGEPTLYMDTIRKVVEAVPQAKFIVATNGVNLGKYLPYFREHNFQIALSYDGGDVDLRGFNPLQELIDYPHLSVSTTIFHGNTDFKKILGQFREIRTRGTKVTFFPHIVHHTGESNAAYALTKEDYDSVLSQWKSLVMELIDGYKKTGEINWELTGLFFGLFRRLEANYEYGETYCFNKGLVKVGPTGKPYSCQYIRDVPLSWGKWQEEQAAVLDYMFPKCKECKVYGMCGGGCHKSLDHEQECEFYFSLYSWFRELADMEPAVWRLGNVLQ